MASELVWQGRWALLLASLVGVVACFGLLFGGYAIYLAASVLDTPGVKADLALALGSCFAPLAVCALTLHVAVASLRARRAGGIEGALRAQRRFWIVTATGTLLMLLYGLSTADIVIGGQQWVP